jgi:hypothetical protein
MCGEGDGRRESTSLPKKRKYIPRRAYLLVFVVPPASIESTVKYPRIDSLVTTVNYCQLARGHRTS